VSEAEVGIAMGTGTDVARQCAGSPLVRGDLRDIAKTIRLNRVTMRNMKTNQRHSLRNCFAGGMIFAAVSRVAIRVIRPDEECMIAGTVRGVLDLG
jgi:cation transport ATPase